MSVLAPLSFPKFLAGWVPALAISASVHPSPRLADAIVLPISGVALPLVTCVLGALGVLLARPLARRAEQALALPLFLVVTAIMLITVQVWIIDSRPNALFAFVVSIGLGFSGYSLIELVGAQLRDIAGRVGATLSTSIGAAKSVSPRPAEDDTSKDSQA